MLSLVQQLKDLRAKVTVILLAFSSLSLVSKYQVCIPGMKKERMEKPESTVSVAGKQKCFQKSHTSVMHPGPIFYHMASPRGKRDLERADFFPARHTAALRKLSE